MNSPRGFPTSKITEHYAEFHNEDLIKQGDDPGKIEKFLASKVNRLDLGWWRCSRCKQRVKVTEDDYQCPRCKLLCEPERVAWRMSMSEGPYSNSMVGMAGSGGYDEDMF
jgi:tRNA(Ile2) C34 agmatinyltransferase TiaS